MDFLCLFIILGCFAMEPELWALLCFRPTTMQRSVRLCPPQCAFSMLPTSAALLSVQPIVMLNYSKLLRFTGCLGYSLALLAYLFVAYCIVLYILCCLSSEVWQLSRRCNRFSMLRSTSYRIRRILWELCEGNHSVPHLLPVYLVVCGIWCSYVGLDGIQWRTIVIFCVGQYLRGRHYGV